MQRQFSGSSAAIGSSEKNDNDDDTITAENIQILGGVVNATGGFGAAAIGSGRGNNASGITIKDAKVRAITDDYAAAIGGGQDANGENITIENSVVYAESMNGAAIIGGGHGGTGSKIYIENSVVSLVQKNSCGYDMIGNGAGDQGDASDIYITGSSVAFISTSPFSSDITQNSPIKDRYSGNEVYLLKIANPDGYDVYVDGSTTVAINNSEADPSDTNLYLWLQEGDHSVVLSNLHEQFMTDYHFNYDRIASDPFGAFKLCEADIAEGYRYDETHHWYICAGSETCTTRFNYEKHSGDNATCTDKPTCTACGAVFGDPLGHDFKHYPYVEETCTTDGHLPYYHCVRCDKYFARSDDQLDTPLNTFIIKATGHSMTKHAAVAPDCTTAGSKEYYECGNCGKLFSDVNGKTETTLADVTIKATGRHTFGNWTIIKEADCTNEGSRQHTCTQCGITETGVIEALGHKYSTEWTIDKAPGCTTSGTKSHHCEICGVKADMTNIPAAGHKFGDWSVITPATKKQEGLERRACTVCGETEEKSIPKVPDIAVVIRDPDSSKTDDLPAINGKKKSWDSIRSDILDSTGGRTVKIDVNGSTGIPENVIRALTEKKTAGEFVISDSISIIIDGGKITNINGGIDFTSTSGNIPGLRGKLAGKFGVSQIDFPIGVKISLRPGESGRFANLYRNNGGVRKNIGSAEFDADGSAVISVSEGGELIAMICEFSDVRGDADNDGYVNAKDAAHLLRYVVGMCQLNNSEMADFNLDGTVDARDAAAILRMVVGL